MLQGLIQKSTELLIGECAFNIRFNSSAADLQGLGYLDMKKILLRGGIKDVVTVYIYNKVCLCRIDDWKF